MEVETALKKIERAHRMYRESKHRDALELYTEALGMAKNKAQKIGLHSNRAACFLKLHDFKKGWSYTEALGMAKNKAQKIALHSNRAACYLKLHDFKKAAQECTSVLYLDQEHTGALMLRAQTLVTLKDYQSALFDVNRLMELNPTSDVYRNLQARLRTQLSLAPIPESDDESSHHDEDEDYESTTSNANKKNVGPLISPEPTNVNRTGKLETQTHSNPPGWDSIPKPKGHSGLDYSRWDSVEDDSSEEEEDGTEAQRPQYRFRVRTVGVRPVK